MSFTTFLISLPSIASILAMLFFSIARGRVDQTSVKRWYVQEARRLATTESWSEAWTAYRRVDQLAIQLTGSPEADVLFRLAYIAERQERPDQVELQMRRLLQIGAQGDVRAHRYFAARYAEQEPQNEVEAADRRERLKQHLTVICANDPDDTAAQTALAEIYLAEQDRVGAARQLEVVARTEPVAGLPLAQLLFSQGKRDEALRILQQTGQALTDQLAQRPGDVELTTQLAGCYAMAGRFDAALQLLDSLETPEPIRRQKAVYLVAWSRTLPPDRSSEKLQRLLAALEADPNCQPALGSLLEMTDSEEVRVALRPRLIELLGQGGETGPVHFMLGTLEAIEGNLDQSRFHLDLAITTGFRSVAALNNLAWGLAFGSNPDLERALQLAREAERLDPNRPEVQDTVGRILLLQGKHAEALLSLERALAGAKDQAGIHAAIAECYDALGQAALAEVHRNNATRAAAAATTEPD